MSVTELWLEWNALIWGMLLAFLLWKWIDHTCFCWADKSPFPYVTSPCTQNLQYRGNQHHLKKCGRHPWPNRSSHIQLLCGTDGWNTCPGSGGIAEDPYWRCNATHCTMPIHWCLTAISSQEERAYDKSWSAVLKNCSAQSAEKTQVKKLMPDDEVSKTELQVHDQASVSFFLAERVL